MAKPSKETIYATLEYYKDGHSRYECSEKYGLTHGQVMYYAKKYGVRGGMSEERRAEFAKANQDKATKASRKAAHERAIVRNNDKRIRKEWSSLNNELKQWRTTLKAIREIQSAKRTKQHLAIVSREIDAMEFYEPKIATCKHCGKQWLYWPSREKYSHQKPPAYCSKKCNYKHFKTGNIPDRLRKYGREKEPRDTITLKEAIRRNAGVCYLCGCKTDINDCWHDVNGNFVCGDTYPTRDHIVPISKGGTHTWDNVRLACRKCNSIKNDRLLEECASDLG